MASGGRREPRRTPGVSRRSFIKGAAGAGAVASGLVAFPDLAFGAPNSISVENAKAGSPPEDWDSSRSSTIEGFTTDFSVAPGGTVAFKIRTASTSYRIRIYRLGWYGGLGARHIVDVNPSVSLPQVQPAPVTNAASGLIDCGNWTTSATWTVPANSVSGVYYALFERLDGEGERNHTLFVVRRAGPSDILLQTSEATWQAYNVWGDRCLYPWVQGRGYKVSYNRPEIPYFPETDFFSMEWPLVRWLERNGFDVAYGGNIDTHRNPASLLNRKVFISSGHDEYWSGAMRTNVEAARDAGVHLIFMTGNEVFWRTRMEPSIAGTATPDRTLVCYKESLDHAKIDPSPEWTGTWRDPRFTPPAQGGGAPENLLTGQLFAGIFPTGQADHAIEVPADYAALRFWRNTAIADLESGEVAELAGSTLGFEFDVDADKDRPASSIRLSSTTVSVPRVLQDFADTYAPGVITHNMTMYRAPSGALVWGTGTTQWSYGLDDNHTTDAGVPTDREMQQATVNALGDMGVQPATRQADLVPAGASLDTLPPVSTITSPAADATIPVATPVTITGTSVDAGGGQVAWVEVSVDGGTTWKRATGTASWSCVVALPSPLGARTIRARAVDDSCNLEVNGPTRTVIVGPRPTPCSIWGSGAVPATAAADDSNAVEVGVRFRPLTDGFVTGFRFHKGPGNGGAHVGSLWTASGNRLAQATFANETSSGWQTVSIPPVAVAAATTYVASVHMPQGHYSRDAQYFRDGGYEAWPLRALGDGEDGGNGLFRYGASGFPTSTSSAANYWIDVVFDVTNNVDPTVVGTFPAAGLQSVSRTSPVQATFSEGMNASSLVFELRTDSGDLVPGTTSYDGATRTASFVASAALPALTHLTATVVSASDASGASLAGPHTWSFTTIGDPGSTPTSLWDTSFAPAGFVHDTPFELGVRFRADVAGEITALRFYRPPGGTGEQPGHLWNAAGTLLSTVVFPPGTEPGWQQANLPAPVPVQKNAIYVASYHVPDGRFPMTVGGLNAPVDRAPLHAPASSLQAGNGVYRFGGSGFPTSTFEASNYWADVVFNVPPDTVAPVVVNAEPAANLIAVAIAAPVRATFDGPIAPASLLFTLAGPGGAAVAGAVTYDAATATASFTPTSALANGATYTASVRATDTSGNAMTQPTTWSFTAAVIAGSTPATLWDTSAVPDTAASDDTSPIELGVAFQPERDGTVTGIRFYKGAGNGGTHVGHLWTGAGTLLGSVTFAGETLSGWQQAMFAAPIAVTGGSTYVASYHAPEGHYPFTRHYFGSAVVRPPLTAPSGGNGRYLYGPGGFPTNGFVETNYWVDVIYADAQAPSVVNQVPAAGAVGVPESTVVAATFGEPVDPGTIVIQLRDAGGGVLPGAVDYAAATRTVTLTPSAPLGSNQMYTASVSGATDQSGNPMAAPAIWSFSTGDTSVSTLWADEATPGTIDSGDGSAVELGVKFQVGVAGAVEGVRFYKSAANTGAHSGRLWAADGTLLGTATFTGESASGWQYAPFASPVAVQPGTTYVVSYHAPNGHYAVDSWYFSAQRVSGDLRALADGAAAGNGVYRYGSGGVMPSNTYSAANYWVDLRFRRSAG